VTRRAPKAVFTAHTSDVMSVSVNSVNPNLFVSGSCDALAKVWDVRQGGKSSALSFQGHESDINSVCFLPDGSGFATGSDDSSCILFDLRSSTMLNKYSSNKILCGATSVTFAKSGRFLFASYDENDTTVWDTLLARVVISLENSHDERVSCVSVSPDGQALCTASWDTTMRIWA